MVDEVDLHLHPRWQMTVIRSIARALPRMQFIFTSHSPLVAGSLEWMNIITLKTSNRANRTRAKRLAQGIHGLDADQILLSDFFGLSSTRAEAKKNQLDRLTARAREGDDEAALQVVRELSRGLEESP
jgi:predicted ATP-dependent endonuclease of OLD family